MSSNQPFQIHWLDLSDLGFTEDLLGICSHLPGARHRLISRSLDADIGEIRKHNVRHAFVFCEDNELIRFGIPFYQLQEALKRSPSESDSDIIFDNIRSNIERPLELGAVALPPDYERPYQIKVHHYPITYGSFPDIRDTMSVIYDVLTYIKNNEKVIFVSRDGFGRSSTVAACFLLHTHDDIDAYAPETVYESMKSLMRSTRAIQTVRQYNTIIDFRFMRDNYLASNDGGIKYQESPESLPTHRWAGRERNLSR